MSNVPDQRPAEAAPAALLRRFGLQNPTPLVQTAAARLWRVDRVMGGQSGVQSAVLKHYSAGRMGNEATAGLYLRRAQGADVVSLLAEAPDAVLLDYIEGPTLGDWVRQGQGSLREADQVLSSMAAALQRREVSAEGLLPVRELFAPLLTAPNLSPDLQAAREVARDLFVLTDVPVVGLHGDLHHDNVLMAAGGPRVIDPKGVAGPAAYELANAFRHPRGCRPYAMAPEVIRLRLRMWAQVLLCTEAELLRWAVAKVALSMMWNSHACATDASLLAQLLTLGETEFGLGAGPLR